MEIGDWRLKIIFFTKRKTGSARHHLIKLKQTPVEGAKVTLYNSDEDYRQEKNPVSETQSTDNKGRVKFMGLEPKVYFVDAKKGDMSNAGGAAKTDTLQENRMNKSNIIIE